jgi:NAD(P)-dependent dehydrogenase (short-subunit alcohol dehydrogenase family)
MERKVEDRGRARVDHRVLGRVAVPAGDMRGGQAGYRWPTPALQQRAVNATALKRFGRGREVAWPRVFLASAAAGYITGANLQVDGCLLGRGSEESG